jgi:hypothetical protein
VSPAIFNREAGWIEIAEITAASSNFSDEIKVISNGDELQFGSAVQAQGFLYEQGLH